MRNISNPIIFFFIAHKSSLIIDNGEFIPPRYLSHSSLHVLILQNVIMTQNFYILEKR